MSVEGQRARDLARAATLRERIVGALKASSEPMSVKGLTDMSGIIELYHQRLLPTKIEVQLRNLVKVGVVKKAGHGLYEFNRERREQTEGQAPGSMPELNIRVDKAKRSVALTFEGLRITIEVA